MVKETASRCTKNKKTNTDRNLRMPSCAKNSSSKNDKGILKLFGVEIWIERKRDSEEAMKKSLRTANLGNDNHESVAHHCPPDGCVSDSDARKKAKPWTKKEHQLFLVGLEKLGKGEWKAIAENYVRTGTSTQVASHAQKYFLRLAAPDEKKKRRRSVFDTPLQQPAAQQHQKAPSPAAFDNLELRFWHTNDDNPIYLNQVPGPSKLSDVQSKHIALLYTPTNQRM
ncbi:hypothetical protein Cgig2_027176 [Carnegiea gigantea]|uniref:Uncharacterized protein n=1 Tax=Carnegiea gigantea TaxID=171969 RepID=A0A9Q1QPB3_9CARY|nr:hypothetical protein Cgig2_027176 [Carnegiea gigantea]